jgi:hypothetical protein
MDIFISYSTKDKITTEKILLYIEEKGLKCWYAPRDARVAHKYQDEIINAIGECKAVLLILTPNSNQSNDVVNEIGYAGRNGKTIITYKDNVSTINNILNYYIGNLQWIEAHNDIDEHLQDIFMNCKRIVTKNERLIKVNEFLKPITSNQNYLFVYGSLLDPDSLLRTIDREASSVEYLPASIIAHKLTWINTGKKINMVDDNWKSLEGVYYGSLNLAQTDKETDVVTGAIIVVTNNEIKKLAIREKNYILVDISRYVRTTTSKTAIYAVKAFKCTKQIANDDYVIRAGYLHSINESLKLLEFPTNIKPPDKCMVVNSFYPDSMVKELVSSTSQLKGYYDSLNKYLLDVNCVRSFEDDDFPVPSVSLPLILNRKVFQKIIEISEITLEVVSKAYFLMKNNGNYRKISGFDNADFALSSDEYMNNRSLPEIARVDLSLTDDDIKIFEINTDSPGGMYHLDCLTEHQSQVLKNMGLAERIDCELAIYDHNNNLCNSIVDTILDCWTEYAHITGSERELKTIAIVEKDWMSWSTRSEFIYFRDLFSKRGYEVAIYEPDELAFDGEHLLDKKTKKRIDLVYKRLLVSVAFSNHNDSIKNIPEDPLYAAYRNNSICMVNSIRTSLMGNKLSMAILKDQHLSIHMKENGMLLKEKEKAVIESYLPKTYIWIDQYVRKSDFIDKVDNYILKSFNGYGSLDFVAGRKIPEVILEFEKLFNKQYVIQEKINHGRAKVPIVSNSSNDWQSWNFILGAYLVKGKCIGLEAKFAAKPPITMNYDRTGKPVGYRTAVFPTKE